MAFKQKKLQEKTSDVRLPFKKNVWIKGQTFFCGNKYGDGDDQKRQQQSNFHPASLKILCDQFMIL